MSQQNLLFLFLIAISAAAPVAAQTESYPPPANLGDPDALGRGVERTMTLLESSTEDHRNTVRILLYGQSITAGKWGIELEQHLRAKYPHANLIYERRPLSGFATERLVRTAQFDLYPFYADLVIFHDYGNNQDYETMIRRLREQTTAEILIQADHLRRSEKPIDESDPNSIEDRRQRSAAFRNSEFLPEIARRYGCAFDGRRSLWKDYVLQHDLEPGELVGDDVHPNAHGTYLMTELVKAFLVPRGDRSLDPMNCGYVRTYAVDDAMRTADDSLRFEFDGNRIDVVFQDQADGTCRASIDGKPPLDDPSMLYHSRNRVRWRDTPIPPGPWPPVLKMGFETPLLQEDWSLRAQKVAEDADVYSFQVSGTRTGDDGRGRTDQRFVSDSGRVVIEPEDWDVRFAIVALRRLESMPEEFQIDWTVATEATNELIPPEVAPGVERCLTVAQRLSDGAHRLELTGDVSGVRALRVYSPSRFPCPANEAGPAPRP